jgi:hypothetical protein
MCRRVGSSCGWLLTLVGGALGVACGSSPCPAEDPPDGDVATETPCPTGADVLFVVDDTPIASEAQQALARALPTLLEALASGNPPEGEPGHDPGMPLFDPIRLHVGVIDADMGVQSESAAELFEAQSFPCDLMGNDAVMRTSGVDTECVPETLAPNEGRFLQFVPGETALPQLTDDVQCLFDTGNVGCFVEQPLEASLKAITPAHSDIRFYGDTGGQGAGGANDGFLRDGSLLTAVVLTTEDDCSVADGSLFELEPDGQKRAGSYNSRCDLERNASYLHPVRRYVDGLLALRPQHPQLVLYSLIAGIPTGMEREPGEPKGVYYDRILNDPGMQIQVLNPGPLCVDGDCNEEGTGCADDWDGCTIVLKDFDNPLAGPYPEWELSDAELDELAAVLPVCSGGPADALPRMFATPARRLVGTAKAMDEAGMRTVVSSVCETNDDQLDYHAAMRDIVASIAATFAEGCGPDADAGPPLP